MDKEALFKLGYGLYLISTGDGTRDNGCIINTAMQITEKPLRMMVCINKNNYTEKLLLEIKKFNLSILSQEAPFEIYQHFGYRSGYDISKFDGWKNAARAENGIFYLTKGANAVITAEVYETKDLGTHTMFFADICDAKSFSPVPSVTYDYYQEKIKPKPSVPKSGNTESSAENMPENGNPAAAGHVYVCRICGYVYEGESLPEDYICPVCKHDVSAFEQVK